LSEEDPIRLTVSVADKRLADRLVGLLDKVPGLQLVPPDAVADAAITSSPGTEALAPVGDIVLTQREAEVLALLAEGASNKAIARALNISVHTAKFHVGSLIDKLDAVGRTDVVTHAARLGVIVL
jgi:DNA-binding CsgD family transcriptional regulator